MTAFAPTIGQLPGCWPKFDHSSAPFPARLRADISYPSVKKADPSPMIGGALYPAGRVRVQITCPLLGLSAFTTVFEYS